MGTAESRVARQCGGKKRAQAILVFDRRRGWIDADDEEHGRIAEETWLLPPDERKPGRPHVVALAKLSDGIRAAVVLTRFTDERKRRIEPVEGGPMFAALADI